MKYTYVGLFLLSAITGFFLTSNNSKPVTNNLEQKSTPYLATDDAAKFKEIYERRLKELTRNEAMVIPNFLPVKDAENLAKNINGENLEPEPTTENSHVTATGEFADEVNLTENEKEETVEIMETADSAKVNAPATGDFADQINPDAIFAVAQQKDPNLQPEAKLAEVPANSFPPTELGVYSPPQ